MAEREPDVTAARRRLVLWTIALRAVAASVLLGTAILLRVDAGVFGHRVDPYFALIAVTYALTGLYAASVRYADRHPWLVDAQFAGDIALVSTVVVLSGGVDSYFTSLYALPIVAAGTVARRRGGLLTAVLSAICYGGVVLLQYTEVSTAFAPGLQLPPGTSALYRVAMNGAGLLAVGALTGSLAEGLWRADQRLASASTRIAHLQAFNERVVDSLPGGVLTTDERGHIISVNRAAILITGRAAREMLGVPVDAVLEMPAGVYPSAADEARRVEFEYTKPSGQRILIGLGLVPFAADSDIRGHVFTFQDVTDVRRQEREAQRQRRLAAIGEMAAGIAHEIRNPLASMAGSMQLLRSELPLSDEQAQLMDIVLRESARLNETIKNFLAYARPQRGPSTRVELSRLVEETALLLRNSPDRHASHEVRTNCDRQATCDGDEHQLRQVVWNLASNALRAMPDGGVLSLRVESVPASGSVRLVVEDAGRGMTPGQLENLFQPFNSGFSNGTGLGLAIAHRIVADHGGHIAVSSTLGQGTCATVTLPAASVAVQASASTASDPARQTLISHAA
jgi:two-component system sensor histidine kinase PilS (NtrC family)